MLKRFVSRQHAALATWPLTWAGRSVLAAQDFLRPQVGLLPDEDKKDGARCSSVHTPWLLRMWRQQSASPLTMSSGLVIAAAPASASALHSFLSVFPPLCFGFLQVSGLKTVREIQAKKSVGELSPLPFVSLATNCVVWTLYGFLRSDMTIMLPNISGLLFGLYYTYQYRKYAQGGSINTFLGGAAAIVGGVAAMGALLPAADAAHYIGLTGCTLAVILMASPLATLKTVIQTRNTSAMPFATSLATFMNASSWTGYGLLVANDAMVWGPNAIGLVAACVQLGLFAKYGIQSAPAALAPAPNSAAESVQQPKA